MRQARLIEQLDEQALATRSRLLADLDRIEKIVGEIRDIVIDNDPAMHRSETKAKHGDG